MPRRARKTLWPRSIQRRVDALTRAALRVGAQAFAKALRPPAIAKARPSPAIKRAARKSRSRTARPAAATGAEAWIGGIATTPGGARRWRLYRPAGLAPDEKLPLLVMLHGCGQDAADIAACSRLNRIAAQARFLVLYPEQDRLHNAHGCWNWFETRSGRAQAEAAIIDAAVDQACRRQPVDPARIALAGFSSGAGMAALLATLRPQRYRAVAMHSGVGPGTAHSTATALGAMRGRRVTPLPPTERTGGPLPPLLVIHGSSDRVVAPANGRAAAQAWASRAGASPRSPRTVQRGARRAATVADFRTPDGRLAATLCEVDALGHAWSGGAAGQRYADPKGPDAARLIWSFCAKRFAAVS